MGELPTVNIAAVCVIENALGQILILQRHKLPHGFGLPGGKRDPGETAVEACMREVFEETGISIDLVPSNELGVVRSAIKEFDVHVFYKKFNVTQLPVTLSEDEHVGYVWTSMPEHGMDLAGNTDKMIELWRDWTRPQD